MIETDWITKRLVVRGTFHESDSLTSLFEWDGPPVISTHGLGVDDGRVVGTKKPKASRKFGDPRRMVRFWERYEENEHLYTEHEDVRLELYGLRTEESGRHAYFMPSERHQDMMPHIEGHLTVEMSPDDDDTEYRLWHQRVRFNTAADGSDSRTEHAYVCTPLGENGVPSVTTERPNQTGLGEAFEPLAPITPMAFWLDGAAIE